MAIKDDDEKSNEEKTNSSDENFGLPELEMKPLEDSSRQEGSTEPTPPMTGTGSSSSTPTESFEGYAVDEAKSKAPLILTIVIILVVAIAGYLIYNFVYVPNAKEKARKEESARQDAARKKAEQERLEKERAAAEEQRRLEAEVAKTPPVGTIEILSGRTKRYYVIISSDIDDDLLMDYAKKLSSTGVSLKVIPPFGGKQFHRLAIADHDTFALAQANADAAKATYGTGVWVLKY